jgi:transcriptional regulator with XRE-family HTH domain
MEIYKFIGERIRQLRLEQMGHVVSQEALAKALGTTSNTISRWETAVYKPSVEDLDRVSRFFGVPVSAFFPQMEAPSRLNALMSATGDLDDNDIDEVTRYAQFRKARKSLTDSKRGGRKKER